MLPWGHVAFGYLLYTLWTRRRTGIGPDGLCALALAVGSQFPDLIDKPLSWTFGVLPTGRSFAHSAFFAVAVGVAAVWLGRRYGRESAGAAFAFGHVSHLVGDSLYPLLRGDFADMAFWLWPAVPADRIEYDRSFLEFFLSLDPTPTLLFECALAAVALGVWVHDGAPGLGVLRDGATRVGPEIDRE
ncbi:metal-dependent hydrolase [Halegenticoccus soli]|uniref:metal-dependent hydrolase n=1 Tax=Halegenticoccus soli TaxID=1985678 RepID=UPI000C6E6C25|nr:metal-dependent hydrolase [Halegenticoccus soli]